ncbi:ABC transporter permease subunit [Bacillus gobiensis]|uniref:ABC transporter permease subunit n=1 Tax=Bacillus gobiensis TaxID=1441095 RepID=UPI003D1BF6B9
MDTLVTFLAVEHYSLMFLLVLGAYVIFTSNRLMAKLVDRGSMAYILATPVSRTKIAITQALVLLSGVLVIIAATVGAAFLSSIIFAPDSEFGSVAGFWRLNFIGLLLFFAVSGYCFLFSSLFGDERKTLAFSSGLTLLFYGLDMMGKITEDVEWLRDFTIFSLFDSSKLIESSDDLTVNTIILGAVVLVTFGLTVLVFRKKSLSL